MKNRRGSAQHLLVTAFSILVLAVGTTAGAVDAAEKDDLQAPRAGEIQAPRGNDVQAPRGDEVQAPRGPDVTPR